jgi:outer membrane autotransporter protein
LIDVTGNVASGTGNTALSTSENLKDNSFVINTRLSREAAGSGNLVVTAERNNDEYITKSVTTGHFSNPAALRLGTLAAAGSDYRQDMQTVLNMLDIDQWGFGNNQANLATQAKRLAPVANNSLGLSAVSLGSMSSDSIGMRLHELRNVPQRGAYESTNLWIKNNMLRGTQEAVGDYDGYKSKLSSFSLGMDSRPNNRSLVGAALSYGTAEVLQKQFREGDQTNLKSWQLSFYGAYDFTPELFLGGELSYGNLNSNGSRAAAVGRTALFDFDGQQSAYKFDLGYRLKFADSTLSVTPLLSLEARNIKQDAYTETNAGDIGLNVGAQRFKSKQTGLGLRLSSTEYVGGIVVKPELTLMSVRERGEFPASVTSSFIGDNTSAASFSTVTNAYEPRSTKLALGVGVLMSKTSSMMVRYQHVKKDTSTSNMAELTARWDF